MPNLLNFNYEYYYFFENLSLRAYVLKIQKSKFARTYFRELDHSVPGRQIKFLV